MWNAQVHQVRHEGGGMGPPGSGLVGLGRALLVALVGGAQVVEAGAAGALPAVGQEPGRGWSSKNAHISSLASMEKVVGPVTDPMPRENSLPGQVWPPPSTR